MSMDAEDLKKKLEELGIPTGEWSPSQSGRRAMPLTVQRQRATLEALKNILETQLAKDREKCAALHEVHTRLKHGGGQ